MRNMANDRFSVRDTAWPRGHWYLVLLGAVVLIAGSLAAQVQLRRGGAAGDDTESAVFMNADRKATQALKQAQELLEEKRFGEATRLLGGILDETEDFFYKSEKPDEKEKQRVYRSLKSEARRLLSQLPDEGREAYELQFGATAKRLFEEAVARGDLTLLADVSRRFFHAQAGRDATELLGTCLMERGQPLAAAFCFQRLAESPSARQLEPLLSVKLAVCQWRAGLREPAAETLARVKSQLPNAQVQVGEDRQRLADVGAPERWLALLSGAGLGATLQEIEQWPLYRGSPARTAISAGSSPLLNRRWAVPTVYDPEPRKLDLERVLEQRRLSFVDQGQAVLPGCHPLAVNDLIIFRTMLGVMAVDSRTGKRIWFQEDPAVRDKVDELASQTNATQGTTIPAWLEQRLWRDAVYGTLSSDGQYVFCVEDQSPEGPENEQTGARQQVFMPNGRLLGQDRRTSNRLAAYGFARQGALECESSDVKQLEGAFFLGPPLPLDGRYYVLLEQKGEIRLAVLKIVTARTTIDPRTGAAKDHKQFELDWSQQLAVAERTIIEDPLRRRIGAVPSYADGVLVCPTSAGAIVAVDLTTRSLLWGYRYLVAEQGPRSGVFFMNGRVPPPDEQERWIDSSLSIAHGKVLVTPPESRQLYCLNLSDGNLAWEKPREDGLFVATVQRESVVVVGSAGVRAYKLDDGNAVWPEGLKYPGGHTVSGRGFSNGSRYFLPMTSAEVIAIDLNQGQIAARVRSRQGVAPGNLICFQGGVISQTSSGLESFYQLDELRQQVDETLAKSPEDPAALALQADLLINDGQLSEAIKLLRRSLARQSTPRARQLLFDALLDQTRADFVAARPHLDELAGLIDQPAQRLAYLRVVAEGLQQAGEMLPAFDRYLELIAAEDQGEELERVDRAWSVRRDLWVQARLEGLAEQASAPEREAIETRLRTTLDEAIAQNGTDGLRNFLRYFATHPLADDARLALLDRPQATESALETELLLRQLERSSRPEMARGAVARLVRLLRDSDRLEESASYIARLHNEWGDVACLDGKTGRELVKAWVPAPLQPIAGPPVDPWRVGNVKSEPFSPPAVSGIPSVPLEIRGERGPFFAGATVELMPQQPQSLIGRDGFGRERWRVNVADPNGRNMFFYQPSPNHIRVDGHLVVAALGFTLMGIDTLGTPGKDGPRIIWRQDLVDPATREVGGMNWRQVNMPWGVPRMWASDNFGRPLGTSGPATSRFVCFQRQRNLIAVHPLTGKTLWIRNGIPAGAEMFGDDDLLFVVPPKPNNVGEDGGREALVLRTLDGAELGKRAVPPITERMMTLGRRVVSWSRDKDGRWLVKHSDLWDERDLWSQTFDAQARPWPIQDREVAVLERSGRFQLFDVASGERRVDLTLNPDPQLSEICVQAFANRWVLVASHPPKGPDGFNVQVVPQGSPGLATVNGTAYGFDRTTGKLLWATPLEKRSLPFQQFDRLPVVLFASMYHGQQGNQIGVMALDHRTGKVVYDEKIPGQTPVLSWQGDPAKQEVTLRTVNRAMRLTFAPDAAPTGTPPAGDSPPAGVTPPEKKS